MFSGIIKCVGKIESITDKGSTKIFTISSPVSDSLKIDQSVAHDGVCLTIIRANNSTHDVEIINETLSKSAFGSAVVGNQINLEKSISAYTLLDGHLVQGHVDTTVTCLRVDDLKGSWKMYFNLPADYAGLVIQQGSICINGISLTVCDLNEDSFAVAIIPYTYENTNMKNVTAGSIVNVEFDLIGKYIVRQFELRNLIE